VSSNWITMVQSRLPLLEKAMEATLGGSRQITLEASDRDERSEPAPAPAAPAPPRTSFSPPRQADAPIHRPPPVAAPQTRTAPAPAPPEPSATSREADTPPPPPRTTIIEPPSAAEPLPLASPPAKPQERADDRRLEESAHLFADFFNGQVIAMEPHEEA
ncbi:MAG: hypothetical protein ACK6BC_03320, partial [Cyanobacteriota bacterium]